MHAHIEFIAGVKSELARRDLSVRAAALELGVPVRSFYGILSDGQVPTINRAAEICRALGLEFYIGPPRGGDFAESQKTPRPAWDAFTEATLPHKGIASCSVQGWGKNQPLRDPLPKPEDVMDENAFYVSASGQSMIPEGIDGGAICLVSPGTEVREGDRVWVLDYQGRAAIKRLVEKGANGSLKLRGWMPKRDGQQQSFEEERFAAGIRETYPVVAVFRGRPGKENCEYVPDPRPPAHALPPAPPPNASPPIPKPITDMLGLPEGAAAEAVVAAMEARLKDRGTAHASPAAVLDRGSMGQMLDSKLKSETRALKDEMAEKLDALAERLLRPDPGAQDARRLPLRQFVDVRAAAGPGEDVFEDGETGTLIVAADDIPPGLRPDRLVGIRAAGRSMEPTIHTDDILVLNLDVTEPREGAIFVVRTDTGLVVKRLRQDGGVWTMGSDADDRAPRPVAEEDHIIGHVVWFGPEGAIVVGGG